MHNFIFNPRPARREEIELPVVYSAVRRAIEQPPARRVLLRFSGFTSAVENVRRSRTCVLAASRQSNHSPNTHVPPWLHGFLPMKFLCQPPLRRAHRIACQRSSDVSVAFVRRGRGPTQSKGQRTRENISRGKDRQKNVSGPDKTAAVNFSFPLSVSTSLLSHSIIARYADRLNNVAQAERNTGKDEKRFQ